MHCSICKKETISVLLKKKSAQQAIKIIAITFFLSSSFELDVVLCSVFYNTHRSCSVCMSRQAGP